MRGQRGPINGGRARRVVLAAATLATLGAVAVACVPDVPLTSFPPGPVEPVVTVVAPDTIGPLRMRGQNMVDADGRTVLLHGMNSVNKGAPFISLLTDGGLGPTDRAYLAHGGFNAVRLGVAYSALMPEAGLIDQSYLDQVVAVVDQLSSDGFWVQLDFHQDLFHLMPAWATPPDAWALSDDPPELLSFIGWAAAYTSPRSIRRWDSFLAGEPIIAGRSVASVLGDAAAALAARVATDDHVIGIEVLNEPFAGTPALSCIIEGCPGAEALLVARYEEMIAPIRAAAPELPLWVEPFAPTGYIAHAALPGLDVTPATGGAQVGAAWHLYCHDTDGGRPERADDATAAFCQQRFANGVDNGLELMAQLGGAGVINEFGASANPLNATLVVRLADERLLSWMYWHHRRGGTVWDSPLDDVVESQIVRPFPQATAGTPTQLSFDPTSGHFTFEFAPDHSIHAPTSIVIPGRQYPAGYSVTVASGTATSAPNSGRLTVVAEPGATKVTVTVERITP